MTSEAPDDRLEECTAALMTVPLEVARRLETFLRANGVACRIRKNETITPEQLAEEAMRSAAPHAAKVLDSPVVGRLLRTRVKHAMKTDIELSGAGLVPAYDVLVRPQDLPSELAGAGRAAAEPGGPEPGRAEPGRAEQPADPWARPGEVPTAATLASPAGGLGSGMAAVTALPWDAAWDLANRLQAAEMPATVLPAGDAPRGSGSIGEAMFHVVVQAGNVDRAKELAGLPPAGPPTER
jgi:hypothetical protein